MGQEMGHKGNGQPGRPWKKESDDLGKPENLNQESPVAGTVPSAAVTQAEPEDPKAVLEKEMLYLRAEFDNYKKRLIREQEQAIRFSNERLVRELLGTVDLLERAIRLIPPLRSLRPAAEMVSFLDGIEMTQKELVQALGRCGVEFCGQVGEAFDPARHEAVGQVPMEEESAVGSPETVLPETIVEVHEKGCSLNGRLIKPARVTVGVRN